MTADIEFIAVMSRTILQLVTLSCGAIIAILLAVILLHLFVVPRQ